MPRLGLLTVVAWLVAMTLYNGMIVAAVSDDVRVLCQTTTGLNFTIHMLPNASPIG